MKKGSDHGSQILNTSFDEEAENLDETFCFFDRMLLDDEFYALLGEFREGVRVHAIFDSSHTGISCKCLIPDGGYRLWGACTLRFDQEWKYIKARR